VRLGVFRCWATASGRTGIPSDRRVRETSRPGFWPEWLGGPGRERTWLLGRRRTERAAGQRRSGRKIEAGLGYSRRGEEERPAAGLEGNHYLKKKDHHEQQGVQLSGGNRESERRGGEMLRKMFEDRISTPNRGGPAAPRAPRTCSADVLEGDIRQRQTACPGRGSFGDPARGPAVHEKNGEDTRAGDGRFGRIKKCIVGGSHEPVAVSHGGEVGC